MSSFSEVFKEVRFQKKVKQELPKIMGKADIESRKFGSTGMEKGLVRRRNLIDFLIDHFGEDRIDIIDLPGIDIKIDSHPVKIKTITGKGGVKIKWTVDPKKVENIMSDYLPSCGILLIRLNWGMKVKNLPSGIFWIPIEAQKRVLKHLGRELYLKRPKLGTNARGVELSKEALEKLLIDVETKHIEITW